MFIQSVDNPTVKGWAQLRDKKGRDKQDKFLVEGVRLVNECLQSEYEVECVVYAAQRGIPNGVVKTHTSSHVTWIGVSDAVFAKCTDTVTPQGVFAIVRKHKHDIEQLLLTEQPLVVVVDGIQDPGNLGTIIRSADAVGATGVVIGRGSVDLYNPKVVRATMGSLFHLPIIETDLATLLPRVRQLSIDIVSTGLQTKHHCYDEDFTKGMWFVVGNEGQGVSPAIAQFVDREMIIPMVGQAESLNVAMATTIILYEALRQRQFQS